MLITNILRNTEFATVDEGRKCPKKKNKNITTTFKLNLGEEVKSPWVFLIFMNFFSSQNLLHYLIITLAVRLV